MKITNKTLFWILTLPYPSYIIYSIINMIIKHRHICTPRLCDEPLCDDLTVTISVIALVIFCILSFVAIITFLEMLQNNSIKFEIHLFKRKKKDTVSILDSLNEQLTLARKYKDQEEINRIENSIKIRNL